MKTLISMTDFVLDCVTNAPIEEYHQVNETFVNKVVNYANFLKQPLKLEMFVPCDDDGNVLEEPCSIGVGNEFYYERALDQYEQSKEKVLFEGFEIEGNYLMYYGFMYSMIYELDNKTIEKIVDDIPNNPLQLTPTALKQIL